MIKKLFISSLILFLFSAFLLCLPNSRWITVITKSTEHPMPGDVMSFSAMFGIQDERVESLVITGGIDGTELYRHTYGSMSRRHRESFTFTWTAVAGSHTVYMQIDPDSATPDSNRTDNRVELTFTVGLDSPAHDSSELGNPSATTTTGGLSSPTQNLQDRQLLPADDCRRYAGETPDVTVDFFNLTRVSLRVEDPIEYRYQLRIKNLSPVCIGRLKYRIVDQGNATIREVGLIPTKHKYAIMGNETVTFSNKFGMSDVTNFGFCRASGGEYICTKVKAILDPDNTVRESNETNNESNELTVYFERR